MFYNHDVKIIKKNKQKPNHFRAFAAALLFIASMWGQDEDESVLLD